MRIVTLVLAACLSVACSSQPNSHGSAPLESNSLVITQIIDMQLATGEHLYILEYRTSHPINDVASLTQEAESLWPTLQPRSEAAGHSTAGIRAVALPTAGMGPAQAYTFIWEKRPSGVWVRLPSGG